MIGIYCYFIVFLLRLLIGVPWTGILLEAFPFPARKRDASGLRPDCYPLLFTHLFAITRQNGSLLLLFAMLAGRSRADADAE